VQIITLPLTGHFGDVFKATINVGVSMTVALKTTQTLDSSSRAQILHEAAMIALFDHKNIVTIIGVITSPRNMPPIIVLEYCEKESLLDNVQESDPEVVTTSMLLT